MRSGLLQFLTLLVALACLWGAGRQNRALMDARQAYHLDAALPLENAPPLVVFSTVALGGFSGIIADGLWIRAARLQREGRYFELVQLSDWITRLEPRFTEGWVYHAWNLAYNVSVMFKKPEDRWRWIRHGIELLRDGGLLYNPADPGLYRELGWIFQHKIGGETDQEHLFYKLSWAHEMGRLFEGPRPDYALIAQLPRTRAEALQQPAIRELVEALRAEGFTPFVSYEQDPEKSARYTTLLAVHPARDIYKAFTRLQLMKERYGLDPDLMQAVEKEAGPIDWRMPQAHAIYWAWRGRAFAKGFDLKFLQRMIFQCMADAFQQGRYFYNADEGLFIPSPLPDLLPYVKQSFETAMQEFPDDGNIQTAHLNFLKQAMAIMYVSHRMADARNLYEEIIRRYPSEATADGFEAYAVTTFTSRTVYMSDVEARSFIVGAFYQGFFWQALGDTDRAAGFNRLANVCWQTYMAPRKDDPETLHRVGLPPIAELQALALQQAREALTSTRARAQLRADTIQSN